MTDTEIHKNTDRSVLNRFLYEEETSFMENYNKELDGRLEQLERALDEKGSVVKPITLFGLGGMVLLQITFFILALISWFGGPVG